MARKANDRETGQAPEKLAGVLQNIATASEKMDDLAGEILAVLKRHKVTTLPRFESVSTEAYALNGWQKGGGRPKADETVTPVPDSIKAYMSQIRKAYKVKLKVTEYESMYELRMAVKERSKAKRSGSPKVRDPELQGVIISSPEKFNGGLFHDAILLWMALDEQGRDEFEKSIDRLIVRYTNRAKGLERPQPGASVPQGVTLQ